MKRTLLIALLCWMGTLAQAQNIHSDNGNGTYTNPVIPADFPDIDVVRVADTYYMLATTMFTFPGVPLLKSKDLVNWEYCKNVVKRMDYGPCYNLDGCHRYGHGQWAGSLKYHNGKFYLLFNTLNEGAFLCTATNPEGEWDIKRLGRGFHDCGLFFDDDGRIYVASGYGRIFMTELDKDFKAITKDSLIFTGNIRGGLEGAHVYKLNGYYYLYCTYGGADGFQVALRSKNIYGPLEQKVVIRDTTRNVNFGIHQGGLIQTQTGEWWTLLFTDAGPLGRIPSLQPVTWTDDWPMVGVNGKAVITYKKPNVGKTHPVKTLPTSDEFGGKGLGMQWSWNHNPEDSKWSLSKKKGFLRLETVKVVDSLTKARNTLTQRPLMKYDQAVPTVATTKLEVANMKDGDIAGLAVFQDPYAFIGLKKDGEKQYVVMVNNGKMIDSVAVSAKTIYFRTGVSNATRKATFEYSVDGKQYAALGQPLTMRFSLKVFTGNKFCLFNYPTRQVGGFVDFDWFRTE